MNVLIVELIENILLDTFYDDVIYFLFIFIVFHRAEYLQHQRQSVDLKRHEYLIFYVPQHDTILILTCAQFY